MSHATSNAPQLPLAEVITALVEIGKAGGRPKNRSALSDQLVAAGLGRKQSELAVAQAFPFPSTRDEFYIAGYFWGCNYMEEGDEFYHLDDEGAPQPKELGLLIIQERDWIKRYVLPLKLKGVLSDPKTGLLPKWINVDPDGVLEENFSQLGIGGTHVNWNLIPTKYRHLFIAGIIDSTNIYIWPADDEYKLHNNYQFKDSELVLEVGGSGLAFALHQGIPGSSSVALTCFPGFTPTSAIPPSGISLPRKKARWFVEAICRNLHSSLVKNEKENITKYEHPNKSNAFTGVRLTESQAKALNKWVSQQSRAQKGRDVKTNELVEQSPTLIGRPISRVTAWSILNELKRQEKLRSRS